MRLAAARSSSTARSTASASTGEQYDGLSDRYPCPPCQRKTDRCPREGGTHAECWGPGSGIRDPGFGIRGSRFSLREPALGERSDERVRDKAKDQQAGKDVHGEVVDLLTRDAGCNLRFADVVHEHRSDDARRRPRGQQATMDRSDVLRTERVSKVRGNGGEATAIHRHDDA